MKKEFVTATVRTLCEQLQKAREAFKKIEEDSCDYDHDDTAGQALKELREVIDGATPIQNVYKELLSHIAVLKEETAQWRRTARQAQRRLRLYRKLSRERLAAWRQQYDASKLKHVVGSANKGLRRISMERDQLRAENEKLRVALGSSCKCDMAVKRSNDPKHKYEFTRIGEICTACEVLESTSQSLPE